MQSWWIAKWERDREKCKCGSDPHVCSDPDREWFIQRTICFREMETRAAERRYEAIHEKTPYHDGTFTRWAAEASLTTPYHFNDGVTIWAAPVDLSPDDRFLADVNAPAYPRGGDDDGGTP